MSDPPATIRGMIIRLAAAAAFAFALAGAPAAAQEKPAVPDAPLPFDPAGDAPLEGDWARYDLADPQAPGDALPPEVFVVKAVAPDAVSVLDGQKAEHRYLRGEAGKSARAFLQGFLGEDARAQVEGLRSLTVAPDPIEVGGKRWDAAVRIDAVCETKLGASANPDMRSEFRIWVAPGVKAGGVVKATVAVTIAGDRHGGTLTLAAQGTAAEDPFEGGRGKKPAAPETPAPPEKSDRAPDEPPAPPAQPRH